MHIYGILKDGNDDKICLYARQQKRHRYKKQNLYYVGEGEGGMILENSIETCILPYTK